MSRTASRSTSGTPRRGAAAQEPIDVDDVEEVNDSEGAEDEGDEEYEVEAIVDSRQSKGKYEYLVAWKGYGSEHNTWEPQDNVSHAKDIVAAYWAKQPKNAAGSVRKRKSSPAPQPKKRGRGRPSAATQREPSEEVAHFSDTHRDPMDKYRDVKNWEDHVFSIDTVERTSEQGLIVYLTMKGKERFGVSNETVNKRCPQFMLRFYEGHLKWRSGDE